MYVPEMRYLSAIDSFNCCGGPIITETRVWICLFWFRPLNRGKRARSKEPYENDLPQSPGPLYRPGIGSAGVAGAGLRPVGVPVLCQAVLHKIHRSVQAKTDRHVIKLFSEGKRSRGGSWELQN